MRQMFKGLVKLAAKNIVKIEFIKIIFQIQAIGYPFSGIIQSIATFSLGLIVACIYAWKLALIILPTAPIVIASVLYEAKHMASAATTEKEGLEEITKLATEAISNIRTVASLSRCRFT